MRRRARLAGELARRADGKAAPAAADAATVRRQLDRLTAFLTARPRPAPHAMARMTDGAVVASPASLDAAVADLPWRWHLWFSNPETTEGKAAFVPVSIELVRTGRSLRSQQWVRSGGAPR